MTQSDALLAAALTDEEPSRIRILYRLLPRSTAISLVTAAIGVWALWGEAAHGYLLAWLAAVCAVCLGRYLLYRAFTRVAALAFSIPRWENNFAAGALLMGLVWGAYTWIPIQSGQAQVIQTFLVGGMALSSAGVLGASIRAFACFVTPIIGMQIFAWLAAGSGLLNAASLLGLTFAAGLLIGYAEFRRALLSSLASAREIERLNQHQRLVFEAVTAGVAFLRDRVIVDCNSQFADMLGYQRDELLGQSTRVYYFDDATWELVGREDYGKLREIGASRKEFHFRSKSGSAVICDATMNALIPFQPQAGVVLILHDITQRKAQETALRDALLLQTATFHNAPAGILMTRARLIVDCNEFMTGLLGMPYDEIVGRDASRWFTSIERWELRGKEIYAAFARGESYTYEEEFVRGDGSRFWCRVRGGAVDPEDPVNGPAVFILVDITEQKRADAALRQSREQLVQVIRASQVGIWDYDLESGEISFSARFFEILDMPAKSQPASIMPITDLVHPDDLKVVRQSFKSHLRHRVRVDCEFRLRRRSGDYIWVRGVGQASWNEKDRATRFVGYIVDIAERKAREDEIHRLAMHDALTGLPNRRLLEDRLDHALVTARRNREHVAVMLLDLDGFKSVNDQFGHAAGDRVLQTVGERLRTSVRGSDTVARTGGDEFVVLMEGQQGDGYATVLAEKILASLLAPISVDGEPVNVGVSIGIAVYPVDSDHPAQLLRMADKAMYAVKESGRNNFRFHEA